MEVFGEGSHFEMRDNVIVGVAHGIYIAEDAPQNDIHDNTVTP